MGEIKPSPLLLISDLDDTIKISNTQSKLITVYRGLFRSSAFVGMAELYREILAHSDESQFFLVSSSPPAIRGKIEYFLKKHKFPAAKVFLRDWIRQPSTLRYKLKALITIIEASTLPVILIGDDTEHDPAVFAHVNKLFPEKVLARYARVVKGGDLPEGTIPFYTAFDVACAELASGRLTSAQVLRIGETVLKGEKGHWLIPWFSLKPSLQFTPLALQPDGAVHELWKKIQEKVQALPKRKVKP